MKQIKVLALASENNAPLAETLLEAENINRMLTLAPVPENLERAAAMPVDAVVILTETMTDDEVAFMEKLYMTRGRLAFILLCREADTAAFSAAMRCGITKVMTSSLTPAEVCAGIEEEVTRVQNRTETAGIREFDSRVLSVFSTKGGTGKSTIAVNLAIALQQSGKRTALIDLDLQFGDVGIFLNLPRCDTISDMAGEANLTPSVVNSYLYKHSTGLQVLCAPVSPELAELIKPEQLDKVFNVLRAEFDYVICDLSPTLDDVSLFALDRSDTVYFITNPEVPTLKNTRTCMGILSTLNYASKVRLVLNRDGDSYITKRDVQTALDMEPVICLPTDAKSASSAINRGIPVVLCYPRSHLSRAIMEFAALETGIPAAKPARGTGSFFRREKAPRPEKAPRREKAPRPEKAPAHEKIRLEKPAPKKTKKRRPVPDFPERPSGQEEE